MISFRRYAYAMWSMKRVADCNSLRSASAADKVISRCPGVGDGASPLSLGVENNSISTGRPSSENAALPKINMSVQHHFHTRGQALQQGKFLVRARYGEIEAFVVVVSAEWLVLG